MANVLTVLPDSVRPGDREKLIRYGLTLTGSYIQHIRKTGTGEILDLTKAVGQGGQANQLWGPNGPRSVYITNVGGTGFSMSIVPGVDNLHWQLCIFSGVATELAAGTYAANAPGLLTDLDIVIEASGRPED